MKSVREALAEARPLARVVEFVAAPTDGSAAAVFRVAFALLAAVTTAGVWMNLDRWFSDDGIMTARSGHAFSLFRMFPGEAWVGNAHVAVLAAGTLMMLVGAFPRLGAVLLFLAHTSLQHRTPQILNSGDRLFSIVALLAATMPLARRFSIASWWRSRRGLPAPPLASSWGMRLLGIQMAYVYANTAMSKVVNGRWQNGRALYDVLASPVFAEWPTWVSFSPIIYAMTWGTLVFEFGFPVLVWFRRTRPWVLLAGVGFHVGIDVLMLIPMFSAIMIVSYGAYLEDAWVHRVAGWLGIRGLMAETPQAEATGPEPGPGPVPEPGPEAEPEPGPEPRSEPEPTPEPEPRPEESPEPAKEPGASAS